MWSIKTHNLTEVIKGLNQLDKSLASEVKSRIRAIANPTLSKARSYASGVGVRPTGSYASSLSLKTHANGVKFVSNDPGGGVIEFANPGAIILRGKRAGRHAGVPRDSTPPRALLKAILEDEQYIVSEVDRTVQEACDEGLLNLG